MPPELIVAILIGVALNLYAVLGGADFGAGVWEFNTALQSSSKERSLIYKAIGPVWEANHVWLIFVLMLLANGFPVALAAISRSLWLPLLLALVGIVFRGAAYAFRSYNEAAANYRDMWGAVFAAASTAAPFFFGASLGAIVSGELQVDADGTYVGNQLSDWLTPLSIFTAFFAVGVCSYLAATFMTREAQNDGISELAELWRQRAISNGLWMGILSITGLVLVEVQSPSLAANFQERSGLLVGIALFSGFASLISLWKRRYGLSVVGVVVTISMVLWSAFIAQYPLLVPPVVSITQHAPENVLRLMIVGVAMGALVLLPSLGFLFWLFKSQS